MPGCSADDYTVGTPVFTYGPIAPSGVLNGSVTITMDETGISQDGVQERHRPVVHRRGLTGVGGVAPGAAHGCHRSHRGSR